MAMKLLIEIINLINKENDNVNCNKKDNENDNLNCNKKYN